jgi:hypothetical protein
MQALDPSSEHPGSDRNDGKSREHSQYLGDFFRNQVVEEEQRRESERENRNRVREGNHCSEKCGVFQSAARAYQVSCDDGLAMAGSQSMRGAQEEAKKEFMVGQADADVAAERAREEARKRAEAEDRAAEATTTVSGAGQPGPLVPDPQTGAPGPTTVAPPRP